MTSSDSTCLENLQKKTQPNSNNKKGRKNGYLRFGCMGKPFAVVKHPSWTASKANSDKTLVIVSKQKRSLSNFSPTPEYFLLFGTWIPFPASSSLLLQNMQRMTWAATLQLQELVRTQNLRQWRGAWLKIRRCFPAVLLFHLSPTRSSRPKGMA